MSPNAVHAVPSDFQVANPHALATILEASETRSIIASSDIFDINGMKLWARNQPVTADLQRKLMDRSLRKPLETCLMAEDGVTPGSLKRALARLIDTEGMLSPLLRPHADALMHGAASLRLHSVVQLLLSAVETARPAAFAHALDAMAVAGALMHARGGDERLIGQAMTAGLLHDVGEMYISPEYGEADAGATLDVDTYRQLVVHPHVGQLLLGQLTDYPRDIVRAVAEHHERLDGSGYPHLLTGDRMSALGKLLSATEEALSALRLPDATLHHASVALRVVPGEFDEHLSGPLAAAARVVAPLRPRRSGEDLLHELANLDFALQGAMNRLELMLPDNPGPNLTRSADLCRHLLHKLRQGWNESGLWSPNAIGIDQIAEAEAVLDALGHRLATIERMARLAAGDLSGEEQDSLDGFCASLVAEPGS
ncbi:MAG: HD domain-containing protein [Gammaproteobacteria bacterium]|nr:HD domain-containing protein [Gammaproteobacteria bacterium]